MYNLLGFFILCFSSLFSIVNPFSTAIIYEALTTKYSKKEKKAAVKKACITMLIILIIFSLCGMFILKFFNISVDALRIGGGIYLIIISLRMLNPMKSQKELHPTSRKELRQKDDIAIVPLAIPFLSGPGAIATTIVLVTQTPNHLGLLILIGVIILITIITYIVLRNSNLLIKKMLGHSGIKTLEKLLGLIILCIGVQFILNGLKDYVVGIII
ncbi:MAG: MarC family protein [Candidatus Woesearchaeota archaeon]